MFTFLAFLGLVSLGFNFLFAIIGLAVRIAMFLSPFLLISWLFRPRRGYRRYYW